MTAGVHGEILSAEDIVMNPEEPVPAVQLDWYDVMLTQTFPASDSIPLWDGSPAGDPPNP